jgi:hypothetical protein
VNKLLVLAAIGAAIWFWNKDAEKIKGFIGMAPQPIAEAAVASEPVQFRCEGKTGCHQMGSCAEATFYIRNCPGTKMDGDGDGIPCERTLCSPG